jgi:hypothetical protein
MHVKGMINIGIIALLVVIDSFLGWLGGYLVDPAFLGIFTPFILILLFIAPAIILFVSLADLRKPQNRTRDNYASITVSFLLVAFLFTPFRPSSIDGFHHRMGQLEQDVYISAARLAIEGAEQLEPESKSPDFPRTETHKIFVKSLAQKNQLVSVSSRLPSLRSINNKYVLFSWGSGLTGAYQVLVTFNSHEPAWLASLHLPPKKLYENVYLLLD